MVAIPLTGVSRQYGFRRSVAGGGGILEVAQELPIGKERLCFLPLLLQHTAQIKLGQRIREKAVKSYVGLVTPLRSASRVERT